MTAKIHSLNTKDLEEYVLLSRCISWYTSNFTFHRMCVHVWIMKTCWCYFFACFRFSNSLSSAALAASSFAATITTPATAIIRPLTIHRPGFEFCMSTFAIIMAESWPQATATLRVHTLKLEYKFRLVLVSSNRILKTQTFPFLLSFFRRFLALFSY